MKLYGGPLDGGDFLGEVTEQSPFIILGCCNGDEKEPSLFACYKLEGKRLVFVNSKTKEEILK